VQQHGRNVVLDLREVDAIDAAGIGSLISLQAAGIYLRLKNLTEPVREVLRVTKLESVFETCESQMARVVFDEGAARSGSMGRVDAGSAAIAD
jgi:anti-anti-sigma factor